MPATTKQLPNYTSGTRGILPSLRTMALLAQCPPSVYAFWAWLAYKEAKQRQPQSNPFEIDLDEYDEFLQKNRGKHYSRKQLEYFMRNLVEIELLIIHKKFNPSEYTISLLNPYDMRRSENSRKQA